MADIHTPQPGGPRRALADGAAIPLVGLGVWQASDGPECVAAVRTALELGYRHVDTAQSYFNEASVGRGLRESGVDRDEVFVTTKFMPSAADPVAALEAGLGLLGLDQVDLYLVHWAEGGPTWAWPGMEEAHRRGLARSIGVSNFNSLELEALAAVVADSSPVVNQIQFSPFEYRRRLLEDCERRDIVLEAWSPLGAGDHLSDPEVGRIAAERGRTAAQVLLRWAVQRGIPVIPKSTRRERIAENATIFDFELSEEEMARLDALDRTGGTDGAVEKPWW